MKTTITITHESTAELQKALERVVKLMKENGNSTTKQIKGHGYTMNIEKDHTTEIMVRHIRYETLNGKDVYIIPSRLNFM